MNIYAINVSECWQSLGSVMEVKSLLGLVDDYQYITKILESELFDNPSINYGFHRIDVECLDQMKRVILSARA